MHIIPSSAVEGAALSHITSPEIFTGVTTTGLVKPINEDRLGYTLTRGALRLCLADGHWGDDAAQRAVEHWLDADTPFPANRPAAVAATSALQATLYEAYGTDSMDENNDRTPETSFIAVEVGRGAAKIISYGDCRLFIASEGTVKYNLPTYATWLGAFSYLGLRQRTSVEKSLVYSEQKLGDRDRLCLFSDGIDECVYETPTIPLEALAGASCASDMRTAVDAILAQVFSHGAEDNATMAIVSGSGVHELT